MDAIAINIVNNYIVEHLDKSNKSSSFEIYIVWKAKVLQNWKYLISSTLNDGMYYELTYNGDASEWYIDVYKKFENRVIKDIKTEKKQKIGKWIHKIGMGDTWVCSECGAEIVSTCMGKPKFNQCPICGERME